MAFRKGLVLSENPAECSVGGRGGLHKWTGLMIDSVRLRILLVALSGWVNRDQLEVIAYSRAENRVLREHVGGRHLRLTDLQRRRLAANGHRLGDAR
jgi:hypothetical protein